MNHPCGCSYLGHEYGCGYARAEESDDRIRKLEQNFLDLVTCVELLGGFRSGAPEFVKATLEDIRRAYE